jgi:hypothetical protein
VILRNQSALERENEEKNLEQYREYSSWFVKTAFSYSLFLIFLNQTKYIHGLILILLHVLKSNIRVLGVKIDPQNEKIRQNYFRIGVYKRMFSLDEG